VGDDAKGRRVIERTGDAYRIVLDDTSRSVLTTVLGELRDEITGGSGGHLTRLFPVAYHADPVADEEFRRLMHGELAASHLAALETTMGFLARGDELGTDDVEALMRSLNATRLVLGTILDVSDDDARDEEEDDRDADGMGDHRRLYAFLGWALGHTLDVLGSEPTGR
jgi:hypothetical protein